MKKFVGIFFWCCLSLGTEPEAPPEPDLEFGPQPVIQVETNSLEANQKHSSWRGALEFGGIGALSTVEEQPDYSGGLGWNIGLQAEYRSEKPYHFTGTLGYQLLTLTKFIASSGGVVLDQYSEFRQTQEGLYGQVFYGQKVFHSGADQKEQFEVFWDLGIEYFYALHAVQETSFNTVNEFEPSKFLFAVTGGSIAWKIRGDWELLGHGRFFINTVGESQWRLMGARLTLALSIPL